MCLYVPGRHLCDPYISLQGGCVQPRGGHLAPVCFEGACTASIGPGGFRRAPAWPWEGAKGPWVAGKAPRAAGSPVLCIAHGEPRSIGVGHAPRAGPRPPGAPLFRGHAPK